MRRTNISLTDEQHNWLYEKAHKAKIGMAKLIRIMIDESMSQGPHVDRNSPKKMPETIKPPTTKKLEKDLKKDIEETKQHYADSHRDDPTLGGGSNFNPQPKVGKKKK